MPASLDLAEEYGDDLVVIFVESQGASRAQAELYAYGRKWMGAGAMWTTEAPFQAGSPGLPATVLLSSDGEVLLTGNPLELRQKIDDAVEAEVETVRKGPKGLARSLRRSWIDFANGKYASAFSGARDHLDGKDGDSAVEVLAVFDRRLQRRIARVERMIAGGHYLEAAERLEDLAKGVRGLEDYEGAVQHLRARLAADDLEDELAAARAFAKIQAKAWDEGLERGVLRSLERFLSRYPESRAAERARHLLEIAGP